jgi:hypothetical protein
MGEITPFAGLGGGHERHEESVAGRDTVPDGGLRTVPLTAMERARRRASKDIEDVFLASGALVVRDTMYVLCRRVGRM